jgi:hypothetical protein
MIDINTLIEKLKIRCQDDLPGEAAQNMMLPKSQVNIKFPKSVEHAIPSAVLILLYPYKDDIYFILTERTNEVQHHKGQISLPGSNRLYDSPICGIFNRETHYCTSSK